MKVLRGRILWRYIVIFSLFACPIRYGDDNETLRHWMVRIEDINQLRARKAHGCFA
jgi:hypothetical protein